MINNLGCSVRHYPPNCTQAFLERVSTGGHEAGRGRFGHTLIELSAWRAYEDKACDLEARTIGVCELFEIHFALQVLHHLSRSCGTCRDACPQSRKVITISNKHHLGRPHCWYTM